MTDAELELRELEGQIRVDPATARARARAVRAGLDDVERPELSARAVYLEAQAAAAAGDLDAALPLIAEAQARYASAGRHGAAARTNLGRANVLNEMGRHDAALEACDAVLAALAERPADLDDESMLVLAASAHLNRGLCCHFTGRHDDALASYAVCEDLFTMLGDTEGVAEVANNRGLVLLADGRVDAAAAEFARAVELLDDPDQAASRVLALASLAEAQLLRGDFADSLDTLGEAKRLLTELAVPMAEHDRSMVAARAYEALNLHPEAEATFGESEVFFMSAGMTVERTRATWGRGRAHAALERWEPAAEALDSVIGSLRELGERRWLASALVDRAYLDVRAGAFDTATHRVLEARAIAAHAGAPVEIVRAEVALARIRTAPRDRAEALAAAQLLAGELGLAPVSLLVDRASGLDALERGDLAAARVHLERAASVAERLRGSLRLDDAASVFMSDKRDVLDGLVELELAVAGDDRANRVLAATERARSRTLTEMVTGVADRARNVASTLTSLERELDATYGELFSERSGDRIALLRTRAADLERALTRRALEAHSPSGGPERLVPAAPASLEPGLTMLAWYCTPRHVVAVVERDGHAHVVAPVSSVETVAQLAGELALQWDRMRADAALARRHAARLERSCRTVLGRLYDELVRPVHDLLPAADGPILVVPHGVVHGLPVHAFHDGEAYVVERFEVSYAPSRTDYLVRRDLAPRLGGALVLAAPDEFAPEVVREARTVSGHLLRVDLRVDAEATAATLMAEAGTAGVLHLACHAMYREDNPMFSGLRLHDRWVTARELLGLDLTGALVTLSACDSGRAVAVRGEELMGFVRAVLGAGARTLVASQWSADDGATSDLMASFYDGLDGRGPASAMRQAQLAVRTQLVHPHHWAAFTVNGGR